MRPEILFPFYAPIETLNGIGKKTAVLCEKLCGSRVIDLLFHLPNGFIDRRLKTKIQDAPETGVVTMEVLVERHLPAPSKKSPHRVVCSDETGTMTIVFFRSFGNYPQQALPVGEKRLISGKIERFGSTHTQVQMTHPDYILELSEADKMPQIECVYPLTAGLSGKILNKSIRIALEKMPLLPDWTPPKEVCSENWLGFSEALKTIHSPENEADLQKITLAKRRLAYDELLANQLALTLVRKSLKQVNGRSINGNGKIRKAILDTLGFSLTDAQNRVIKEINQDMASPLKMLRLVQGDVGSGKTIVALFAMLNAVEAGFQAALMAPTDILAKQHFASFLKITKDHSLNAVLLTGRDKGKKRQEVLEKIASGEAQIIIGTHALFSEDVHFKDLVLTIIDEQHKFGVHQRLSLSEKGLESDMLVMTATPIPRTLALTAYGDMEASQIDELPKGRKPITTSVLPNTRLEEVARALERTLAQGNKVYWVCPLVEESEKIDLAAAQERYEYLNKLFPNKVGLVHGKMKSAEKDEVMQKFVENTFDILVATTVIEVGVDVPSATVIVIEHAERFGLAQLHQLRGRIGRGDKASTCLLLYSPALSQTAQERLKAMRDTQNGFEIAEKDLILRGAGEVLGTRQSGIQEFKMADLSIHQDLVKLARKDAVEIIENDPHLSGERGKALRLLLYLFGKDEAIKTLHAG